MTRQIVVRFLDAYNSGALDTTDRFIAPAGRFKWYGAPGRQFPDAPDSTDRSTLPAYFAEQHARGDRLELKVFHYNGISGDAVNFDYTLAHTVLGGPVRNAPGKGALDCGSDKIAVWRIDSW